VTARRDIEQLLESVASHELSSSDATERLVALPYRDLGFARVDTHRELRQGAPEVVLGEGKTPDQVAAIARALDEAGASSVLVTRADDRVRAAVRAAVPHANEHELARSVWVERRPLERRGRVLIVSAGTSDGPVVHEARSDHLYTMSTSHVRSPPAGRRSKTAPPP
jgi:NCAIR mutase (PurE)-related protein